MTSEAQTQIFSLLIALSLSPCIQIQFTHGAVLKDKLSEIEISETDENRALRLRSPYPMKPVSTAYSPDNPGETNSKNTSKRDAHDDHHDISDDTNGSKLGTEDQDAVGEKDKRGDGDGNPQSVRVAKTKRAVKEKAKPKKAGSIVRKGGKPNRKEVSQMSDEDDLGKGFNVKMLEYSK